MNNISLERLRKSINIMVHFIGFYHKMAAMNCPVTSVVWLEDILSGVDPGLFRLVIVRDDGTSELRLEGDYRINLPIDEIALEELIRAIYDSSTRKDWQKFQETYRQRTKRRLDYVHEFNNRVFGNVPSVSQYNDIKFFAERLIHEVDPDHRVEIFFDDHKGISSIHIDGFCYNMAYVSEQLYNFADSHVYSIPEDYCAAGPAKTETPVLEDLDFKFDTDQQSESPYFADIRIPQWKQTFEDYPDGLHKDILIEIHKILNYMNTGEKLTFLLGIKAVCVDSITECAYATEAVTSGRP